MMPRCGRIKFLRWRWGRLFSPEQQRAVVDICRRELLTSFGLRSLSAKDKQYRGNYAGDARYRDSSYHQGTVWGWLMGPFVQAFMRLTATPSRPYLSSLRLRIICKFTAWEPPAKFSMETLPLPRKVVLPKRGPSPSCSAHGSVLLPGHAAKPMKTRKS